MGRPSLMQIAEAIHESARRGESAAAFDARYAGLSRLSDEELAAMGIVPPPEPAKARTRTRFRGLRGPSFPRFAPRLSGYPGARNSRNSRPPGFTHELR
jgi:hypothetical protein